MAIKNSVAKDFLSTFLYSIGVFDCFLPGVVNVLKFYIHFSLSILKLNVGYQGWNLQKACHNSKQGRS